MISSSRHESDVAALPQLLEQQASSKVTSKKKRRLEKYIVRVVFVLLGYSVCLNLYLQDKKLKKEERVHILEKLACVITLFLHSGMQTISADRLKHNFLLSCICNHLLHLAHEKSRPMRIYERRWRTRRFVA